MHLSGEHRGLTVDVIRLRQLCDRAEAHADDSVFRMSSDRRRYGVLPVRADAQLILELADALARLGGDRILRERAVMYIIDSSLVVTAKARRYGVRRVRADAKLIAELAAELRLHVGHAKRKLQ